MPTQCISESLVFSSVEGRRVVAGFDGGVVTTDAGALLLGAAVRAIGLVDRFAARFMDGREWDRVVHDVKVLVGQRVFGIALGYEDVNGHDELRFDPVVGALCGRLLGWGGGVEALAGKSTLNRVEHAPTGGAGRHHKTGHDASAIENVFVELFLEAHDGAPGRVLDLDATGAVLYGQQEGRFFHGCYDSYCYLPLYVFCGRHLLCAKLRRSNIDASAGAVEEVAHLVGRIRSRWPGVEVLLRGDSGFAREALMGWCEANGVEYLFGLARTARLQARIAEEMLRAEAISTAAGSPTRLFADFLWTTRDSWSRARQAVAKAEWTHGKANPRFVVTSLAPAAW